MGIDVADAAFVDAGVFQSRTDRCDGGAAVRRRARAVEMIGLLAAAPEDAEHLGATGNGRFQRFQHQRRRTFGDDETVTILAERLGSLGRRVVLRGQRREQCEADQRLCRHRAVGADGQCPVGAALADRLDAELDRRRAGSARGRQRHRQAARAVAVGKPLGNGAEGPGFMQRRAGIVAQHGEEAVIGIARTLRGRRAVGKREAVAPVRFDRRGSEEERAAELAGDAGLRQRLVRRLAGIGIGALDRVFDGHVDEIDRAGNAGIQPVDREAGDVMDTRDAAGERGPVVLEALPERRDDAHACHGDDGATEMIPVSGIRHGRNLTSLRKGLRRPRRANGRPS